MCRRNGQQGQSLATLHTFGYDDPPMDPAEPADPALLPPPLKQFKAAPPLVPGTLSLR